MVAHGGRRRGVKKCIHAGIERPVQHIERRHSRQDTRPEIIRHDDSVKSEVVARRSTETLESDMGWSSHFEYFRWPTITSSTPAPMADLNGKASLFAHSFLVKSTVGIA